MRADASGMDGIAVDEAGLDGAGKRRFWMDLSWM